MKVFLAGASGAIGRRLVPLLVGAGHQVTGTTRSSEKARALEEQGATPTVLDIFDARAVSDAVQSARPDVVIHQLTDLPRELDPAAMEAALARNARIRIEGTANLVAASRAASVPRLVVQSIAFVYAPGREPHLESDPLYLDGPWSGTVKAVASMEGQALGAAGLAGLVLRYGLLYGPGTWYDAPAQRPTVHVDAAAHAALLAIDRGEPGIYNVADEDGAVSIVKARAQLGFDPEFRMVSERA